MLLITFLYILCLLEFVITFEKAEQLHVYMESVKGLPYYILVLSVLCTSYHQMQGKQEV